MQMNKIFTGIGSEECKPGLPNISAQQKPLLKNVASLHLFKRIRLFIFKSITPIKQPFLTQPLHKIR